jgi:hypothetical protein
LDGSEGGKLVGFVSVDTDRPPTAEEIVLRCLRRPFEER